MYNYYLAFVFIIEVSQMNPSYRDSSDLLTLVSFCVRSVLRSVVSVSITVAITISILLVGGVV
jgi:hypothetical protein